MKKTNLRNAITQVADSYPGRLALITPKTDLSFRDLSRARWQAPGSSVVIFCREIADAVRALVALDGAVEALCMLPVDMPKTAISALLQKWNFDTVLTDLLGDDLAVFTEAGLAIVEAHSIAHAGIGSKMDQFASRDTTWLVPTSGTTSLPKLVIHSFQSLALASNKLAELPKSPLVWALFYDPSRFAGYQVLLRSLLGGHSLVVPSVSGTMDGRVAFCADKGVTHVSATPTLWRKILMTPAGKTLPLRQITLGGEAADQPVLSALAKTFPQARVTHVYASTEAGVGLSVSDGRAGFPIAFLGSGYAGIEAMLRDDRLFLRSARSGRKYSEEADFRDNEGWIDTGDIVTVDGDRFFIIGRSSGVLNVGGDKILPEQVRQVLLENVLVLDAVVYGKTNPFTGTLLVADIKLYNDADPEKVRVELDVFLKERLSSAHRPRVLRFVDEIAINSTGKVIQR